MQEGLDRRTGVTTWWDAVTTAQTISVGHTGRGIYRSLLHFLCVLTLPFPPHQEESGQICECAPSLAFIRQEEQQKEAGFYQNSPLSRQNKCEACSNVTGSWPEKVYYSWLQCFFQIVAQNYKGVAEVAAFLF